MSVLGGAIVLAVVVWVFFAVSYMNSKRKSQDGICGSGKCNGDCMSCSVGKEPLQRHKEDKTE